MEHRGEIQDHVVDLQDKLARGAESVRDFFQGRSQSGRRKRERADVDVRVVDREPARGRSK
jgi:hypothetical protein